MNMQEAERFFQKTKKVILAVDDEPVVLSSLKATIDGENYKFYGTTSGRSALRFMESHETPDLILLDVEMPDMNGYEVLSKLKARNETADIPVIFLTARSDDASELEGLSLGAADYIVKPTPPALLLKRIEVHLLVQSHKQLLIAQQQELVEFNSNLQQMVAEKTKTVVELKNAVLITMAELVEYRDDITGGHIERTQSYLNILMNAMQKQGKYKEETTSWDFDLVFQSAQLHDVGKIAIKDSILQKPGKLTDEEFEIIKTHTTFGKAIIEKIQKKTPEQAFLEYAKVFAVSHHERWDGNGYPNGLSRNEIPLLGRIMAVVDVYDALVSERHYKKAFSHEDAVRIISENAGKQFDPVIASLFLDVSDEFASVSGYLRNS